METTQEPSINANGTAASAANTSLPNRRPRVLVGITGSVAAVKGPEIVVRLVEEYDYDVRVLLTQGGQNFWDKAHEYNSHFWAKLERIISSDSATSHANGSLMVHYADDEWKGWNRLGDPVLHIDLRDWADVVVVAPLSAHTLAKMAHGLCDDTLSCVIRAWDFGQTCRPGKPVVIAPAMNTAMWQHPLTQNQLVQIQGFWNIARHPQNGVTVVAPQIKTLACGEVGDGALATTDAMLEVVKAAVQHGIELQKSA